MLTENITNSLIRYLTDEDSNGQNVLRSGNKEMTTLNESRTMQIKYTETWVAVLGILFNLIP